jgi:signal transduction histidine kinase
MLPTPQSLPTSVSRDGVFVGDMTAGLVELLKRPETQQLLLNLIMNGVEAMASVAGRPKELTIETRMEGADHVLTLVRDSGVGLDYEKVDQIFNALLTTKPEGTGMGLTICRSIVEAHDGHIWASPATPHEAVLHFTLPAMAVGKS